MRVKTYKKIKLSKRIAIEDKKSWLKEQAEIQNRVNEERRLRKQRMSARREFEGILNIGIS